MIEANNNQLFNVNNPHQGKAKKVLCVCSAGLLRSPSMAVALNKEFGFNNRAVGSCKSFALIPISQALINWADEIVFVNKENYEDLDRDEIHEINFMDVKVTILDIPDQYNYGDPILLKEIIHQYNEAWEKVEND